MSDKLSVYNAAATRIGTRTFNSLSDSRPAKRVFDSIWDSGLPKRVLEKGQWNSCIRAIESIYDPDYAVPFGFLYSHSKPPDWVKTVALCSDPDFLTPLSERDAVDEHVSWYSNYSTIYVKYISSNIAYGGDLSIWPESQIEALETELAYKACRAITGSDELTDQLRADADRARRIAKSIDQMNQPLKARTASSWIRARRYGSHSGLSSGMPSSSSSSQLIDTTPSTPVTTPVSAFSDAFSDAFA